jgi:ribosomal protein S6--L-glutamate ligase
MRREVVDFIVGFEEWAGLPLLGLPSLKAKVDTGARTSALHARVIEPFEEGGVRMVRFKVQPVPRRPRIEIDCIAPVVDRRSVTSSNGEAELRFVIATDLEIGAERWPIEITLTNRAAMSYRMLIGRQALLPGMLVDPKASFRQARRSHKVYRKLLRTRTDGAASNG